MADNFIIMPDDVRVAITNAPAMLPQSLINETWQNGYDTQKWGWGAFVRLLPELAGSFYANDQQKTKRLILYAESFANYQFALADFRYGHITDCIFDKARITHANLQHAVFVRCSFVCTSFWNSDLSNATFVDCNLDKADFTDADLTNTYFRKGKNNE